MAIPFKLEFKQNNTYIVDNFARTEADLFKLTDDEIPVVKENITLEIIFSSTNPDDKLSFDLLDIVYKDDRFDELTYIQPSSEPITIYDSNATYTGALIPGYYQITVISNNESYYSWLKVKPKQVTEEQWIVMREEVEAELTGLARDILYKRTGTQLNEDSLLPLSLLNKIQLINSNFNKWKLAIYQIMSNPRYRIKREYHKINKSEASEIDHVAVKKMTFDAQATLKGKIYSVKNRCSNDTLENRWLKFYITRITKNLRSLLKELDSYEVEVEQAINIKKKRYGGNNKDLNYHKLMTTKEDLQSYRYKMISILQDCHQFLTLDWMQDLDEGRPLQQSLVVQADMNYRHIFKFYKDLMTDNYEIKLNNEYTYYWKRTDQLYEIWSFIQFIKALTSDEIGYQIKKGWIYNQTVSKERTFEVPFLKQGEIIKLFKDDTELHLVYDQEIDEDVTQLLYTDAGNKRPDLRLDFFKEGEYINSIIIDFKYRPLKYIWNPAGRNEVMDQLTAYRDNFYSQQIYSTSFPGIWRAFRAIQEVWGVYPQHKNNRKIEQPRNMRLVELTPDVDKVLFVNQLKKSIEDIQLAWRTLRDGKKADN
ncbi:MULTISPECIES: DUF2357 domain-containing protein [Lysinibacillus]|uniref:DUF2357 domain-containing protein n=1 Tax=Lysinibacillus TaxID=400634 RepID=UPI0021A608E8|nr:DUF2357 domain-containing protein [Lysinibacillus capsici]MCT1540260.1 DUF2357 domain-containing protein [Lysinibacillus capsici]MCT1571329.1 DUF2357 domain-containing protein [Lysinibacillus capsici]MCT1647881.1 DUF2357 domain-containing protein [Lysinibacillus capsici]MCT1726423.1 DUF2357 domain-containing protein [Lysinibacillus capsici]MCT1783527.1 DUF2357 domain-containing protein [Lysinibacillus capsici]